MSVRALIVHATNLLARGAIMVASDRVSPDGAEANGLYGVARSLKRALAFKVPDVAVAVIDTDSESLEPAVRAQAEKLPNLLKAHGLHVIESDRAADLVASYTRAALTAGYDVVIVGSDKRLAQLVGPKVWWYDAYKDVRYTPELVRKRFEVGPDNVADWLSLVGDDGTLPGIKGIGKKGATTLIENHGNLTEALAQVDTIKGRSGNALRADLPGVDRERKRAVLAQDLTLPSPFQALEFEDSPTTDLQQLYIELGFVELLSNKDNFEIDVKICGTEKAVDAALSKFDQGAVSVHALIDGTSAVLGPLAGLALAQRETIVYLPLVGKGVGKGDTLSELPLSAVDLLENPSRPIIGHDTKDLATALQRIEINLDGVVGDSACASHLTEPSNWATHELGQVARYVLHRALPDEDSVLGVGRRRKNWAGLSIEDAAAYAGQHADAAEKIWNKLGPTVDPDFLAEYFQLGQTLTRMELAGIACDRDDLAAAGVDFERLAGELEKQVHDLAGHKFNLGSTKQLGSVLFEQFELPIVKRTKTGWSTATEALERIQHAHPVVGLVIRWRRVRRLMDSWVTSLQNSIACDGRVRSTVSHTRSFSGRLINANPDLGRVPGRTEEMARIRHAFAAPEGSVLLSVDYRQLGLYVLGHLSKDPALLEPLAERADMHALTASTVLEKQVRSISVEERQLGKVINFATFAGQGASALALQLAVSATEAKQFIARFDKRYSLVRSFQDEQLRLAKEQGFITTIAGRRWPIGGLESADPMLRGYAERLARRATHEASVCDVSRRGLLRADTALRAAGLDAVPLVQVLDEVLFEVPEHELMKTVRIAADAMRQAFETAVPLRVGCKVGPNWADLKRLEIAK